MSIPAIVEFWDETSKRSLGVGAGRPATVVTYQDSSDPPYFITVGDHNAQGKVSFCYGQEESEYLQRSQVPMAKALEAVRDFFEKPGRPCNLSWESL